MATLAHEQQQANTHTASNPSAYHPPGWPVPSRPVLSPILRLLGCHSLTSTTRHNTRLHARTPARRKLRIQHDGQGRDPAVAVPLDKIVAVVCEFPGCYAAAAWLVGGVPQTRLVGRFTCSAPSVLAARLGSSLWKAEPRGGEWWGRRRVWWRRRRRWWLGVGHWKGR